MFTTKQQFIILHDLLLKEEPCSAEAIVWLQGDRYDRARKVFKLYQAGWSRRIIITGNNILLGKKTRPGENNISLEKMKESLLRRGVKASDLLIDDGAMNTNEQAKHVLKMAKRKKWRRLILVGSSYYQPRAFLTFLKQAKIIKWGGEIINQPAVITWDKKPAGRNKLSKLLFNEEFQKIKKYKKDLFSISGGIKYLRG